MKETEESTAHSGTHTKKEAFLAAYRQSGVIYPTCDDLGIGRRTVYHWLEDPEYKQQFQDAHEDFVDSLEEELYKRVKKNTIKGKNDLSLFCALKANRREKFGDNLTITPQESLITFKVVRVEVVEPLDTSKQLPGGKLTSEGAELHEERTDGEEAERIIEES